MLVLLSPCPKNVPSMKLEMVEGFLWFKQQHKGIQLIKISSSDPICDVFGKPLAWRAPKNADIFKAAITNLHKVNGERNTFHDFLDCHNLPRSKCHCGCDHHFGHPQIYCGGDPTNHEIFVNTMSRLQNDDYAYREEGSSQPSK